LRAAGQIGPSLLVDRRYSESGIFGGQQVHQTAEWTFTSEQSELNFPHGFSASNASAQWFASASAACQLMWQWVRVLSVPPPLACSHRLNGLPVQRSVI